MLQAQSNRCCLQTSWRHQWLLSCILVEQNQKNVLLTHKIFSFVRVLSLPGLPRYDGNNVVHRAEDTTWPTAPAAG